MDATTQSQQPDPATERVTLDDGTDREPTPDEADGMAWWNSMTRGDRMAAMHDTVAELGRQDISAHDCWRREKRLRDQDHRG